MANWLKDSIAKIKQALTKTKANIDLESIEKEEIIELNEDFYDELFEKFIRSDMGFDLSEKIITNLKHNIREKSLNRNELNRKIIETIKSLTSDINCKNSILNPNSSTLIIYLIVGVNGSGKTTSIGKFAKKLKGEGNKVLIVAGDTFRAAAGDQLTIWAKKANVDIFSLEDTKKPDAVVFKAIEKAKKENYNVLLIDTAGRLQSQANLMEELKKINSVIEKNAPDATKENFIVLDATIGQNAISQAKEFSKATKLTGIILAKLDSSAKGGVVLNIINELLLPVKLIGTGEKIDNIAEFNLDEYLQALIL